MPSTIWLASYPKSGNTWFRIFLANLLYPDQAPIDLNELPMQTPIASDRFLFDDLLGLPSALLSPTEVERLRPAADLELNRIWKEPMLLRKAHDAYTYLADGCPLLGSAADFSAVYILRDPWDVAVSLTNHFRWSLNEAVDHMCDPQFTVSVSDRALRSQFAQRLLSWQAHALSWLEAPLSLHLLRYEHMRRDPLRAFRGAARFLGLEHDDQAIDAALEACRFERLQRQEQEQRFREGPKATRRFFRSGTVGEGLHSLGADQLQRLAEMKQKVEQAIAERGLST